MNKLLKIFAQFIYERNLKAKKRIERLVFKIITKIILKFCDPIINYRIRDYDFQLPFSHKLPFYVRDFPQYSLNIIKIARGIKKKYPDLKAIDIGANIGDTVLLLRRGGDFAILAIEGDEEYSILLERNTAPLKEVIRVKAFIGESKDSQKVGLIKSSGSGRLSRNFQDSISLVSLESVLNRHNDFLMAKFIKIDTDGFDYRILQSSREFLVKARPVIFFEYDPYLAALQGDDCFKVFALFRDLGYKKMLVYNNFGDYMLSLDIDNFNLIEEVHCMFLNKDGDSYCDICVFHCEDIDIFEKIRAEELSLCCLSRVKPV